MLDSDFNLHLGDLGPCCVVDLDKLEKATSVMARTILGCNAPQIILYTSKPQRSQTCTVWDFELSTTWKS